MQASTACLVKTRRAPSLHCRNARVFGHTTTAVHGIEHTTTPPPLRHGVLGQRIVNSRIATIMIGGPHHDMSRKRVINDKVNGQGYELAGLHTRATAGAYQNLSKAFSSPKELYTSPKTYTLRDEKKVST